MALDLVDPSLVEKNEDDNVCKGTMLFVTLHQAMQCMESVKC